MTAPIQNRCVNHEIKSSEAKPFEKVSASSAKRCTYLLIIKVTDAVDVFRKLFSSTDEITRVKFS